MGNSTELDLTITEGSTAFMFLATALVQFMTPGVAFFYGGLVQSNNVLTILLYCLMSMGAVFVAWYVILFSLVFGDPIDLGPLRGFVGNPFTYFCFKGVDAYTPLIRQGEVLVPGFSGLLFATYMGMFAVITPCLITGAFVGRIRMLPFACFSLVWMSMIYVPLAAWTWGGGWMYQYGARDFAGGMVIHQTSGFASLAIVLCLGRRTAHLTNPQTARQPHNVPFVVLGTAMLFFGWFGFNGGSAFTSKALCTVAFFNSHMAASSGIVTWVLLDIGLLGKPKLVGGCAGAVAGLVSVTPAAGYVSGSSAFTIGMLAAVCCRSAVMFVETIELDDATDVWAIHGVGGLLGTVLTAALADGPECEDPATAPKWCVNPGEASIFFTWKRLSFQCFCGLFSASYAFGMTYAITVVLCRIVFPRENADVLDTEELGEVAYQRGENKNGLDFRSNVEGSTFVDRSYNNEWKMLRRPSKTITRDDDEEEAESDPAEPLSKNAKEQKKVNNTKAWALDENGEWART